MKVLTRHEELVLVLSSQFWLKLRKVLEEVFCLINKASVVILATTGLVVKVVWMAAWLLAFK